MPIAPIEPNMANGFHKTNAGLTLLCVSVCMCVSLTLFLCSALGTRGWIDISSGRESHAKKSIKYFDEALKPFEGGSWITNTRIS